MEMIPLLRNGKENNIFEPTCAHAQWALMHRLASVCDWTKIQTRNKFISRKVLQLEG